MFGGIKEIEEPSHGLFSISNNSNTSSYGGRSLFTRGLPNRIHGPMAAMESNSIYFNNFNNFAMESNMSNACNLFGPPRPRPTVGGTMTQAACYSNIALPQAMNLKQEDLIEQERFGAFRNAWQKAEKEIGAEFEKPGLAKEYKERHYYIKNHKNHIIENPLWLDFAEHIISNKSFDNFLSKYVLYNKIEFNEFLLILSIIGLPIENPKQKKEKIPNSRLVSIIPSSNLILFTKELIESQLAINNKLLISQNVIDDLHKDFNVNTNNCSI